jgi:glycyl-tRNA synthetase beta chain
MTDFLLELRSEEIPARMQDKARDDLARLFSAELAKAGLKADDIATYATPRRLALIAKGLPLETQAVNEETKGPKVGSPPQAMDGFLRKVGLTQDQLVERDGVYFAVAEKPGRQTADVLAEAIPAIIRAFPWPKSQRWGAASASTESLRWVRPLQGIVALLGDDVVACEVDGIHSGSATTGHRFHHEGEITIGNAADYAVKLRAAHVIVDQDERRAIIRAGAEKCASHAGLVLVPDEGLVNENSGLTEWPVPMLGRFDPAFLAVPQEVIQLTARVNQKYFVCKSSQERGGGLAKLVEGHPLFATDPRENTPVPLHHPADGSPPRSGEERLSPAFVCTANIVAHDGGAAIVAGNEKVLAARLSDAKFFWEQDLKVSLDEQAEKLSQITFHEKLGTVADKVERVAKLARWLVEEGIVSSPERGGGPAELVEGQVEVVPTSNAQKNPPVPLHHPADGPPPRFGEDLASQAERAARLCKADLVTGMVGEFPELQGIMGGYYARAQGEPDAVADAVRDHYKPVGQGDDVPTAPVTVAVSLADKLDTIVGFFIENEKPTGSKDPYALRRAALGVLAILIQNNIRMSLAGAIIQAGFWSALKYVERAHDVLRERLIKSKIDPEKYPFSDEERMVLKEVVDDPFSWVRTGILANSRDIIDFFADRLKVQQREAGVRHDLIDAVFALGGEDDLVRLLARVKALQDFVGTDAGANLLAGYKRAANILKSSGDTNSTLVTPAKAGVHHPQSKFAGQVMDSRRRGNDEVGGGNDEAEGGGVDLSKAERDLLTALNTAEPLAAAAIEAEDFEGAMAALASLRAPIDAFFDGVMVNDPDPAKRAFRIGLLTRFRDAVHKVADFSRIEG